MAGRGPAPKDPSKRRRTNADPIPTTVLQPEPVAVEPAGESADEVVLRGPALPDDMIWHPRTQAWWATWRASPQAQVFTATDWDFLIDTAILHTALCGGNVKAAAELRLRVAKFGATPEDRQRLRMQMGGEDSPPAGRPKPEGKAAKPGSRYSHLRVVAGKE